MVSYPRLCSALATVTGNDVVGDNHTDNRYTTPTPPPHWAHGHWSAGHSASITVFNRKAVDDYSLVKILQGIGFMPSDYEAFRK